jgi:hypothetical protein
LDKGGLQGGFGAVTDKLMWVADPGTHNRRFATATAVAAVKASQTFIPSDGGDFQGISHTLAGTV